MFHFINRSLNAYIFWTLPLCFWSINHGQARAFATQTPGLSNTESFSGGQVGTPLLAPSVNDGSERTSKAMYPAEWTNQMVQVLGVKSNAANNRADFLTALPTTLDPSMLMLVGVGLVGIAAWGRSRPSKTKVESARMHRMDVTETSLGDDNTAVISARLLRVPSTGPERDLLNDGLTTDRGTFCLEQAGGPPAASLRVSNETSTTSLY